MASADHCRALAAEAEKLADVVSYTRDKLRLREQAETWRLKAQQIEAIDTMSPALELQASGLSKWWRRR